MWKYICSECSQSQPVSPTCSAVCSLRGSKRTLFTSHPTVPTKYKYCIKLNKLPAVNVPVTPSFVLFFCLSVCFEDRVPLCSPDYPIQATLKLSHPSFLNLSIRFYRGLEQWLLFQRTWVLAHLPVTPVQGMWYPYTNAHKIELRYLKINKILLFLITCVYTHVLQYQKRAGMACPGPGITEDWPIQWGC